MNEPRSKAVAKTDRELLEEIASKERTGEPTYTRLQTDDRVLARVSDGIYRQPASALRELVANAYDADATEVIVQTDAPRFETISVRDNGIGMTREALVHLINHIGGSAKRNWIGAEVGVTDQANPTLSPSGRRLIGKIGIGLFSVSQLSRSFTIITKRADTNYRLIADVQLRAFSEEVPSQEAKKQPETKKQPPKQHEAKFETGSVTIRSVPAEDSAYHGTEIILQRLQPAARDMLRSREIWDRVNTTTEDEAEVFGQAFSPPKYHIGQVDPKTDTVIKNTANLPWDEKDNPEVRFRKLHDAVIAEASETVAKPRLSSTLDRYLQTIWTLGLAAPLPYLDGKHPFDLTNVDDPRFFHLSNGPKGQASEIELSKNQTLRSVLKLKAPEGSGKLPGFDVYIDKIKLARPLVFNDLPSSSRDEREPNKRPLMFMGKFEASLDKIPEEVAGGRELSFEAYFLWTPKVVPTDHNGVLIRINEASGTLFDDTFIGYQVAELTRLSQITAEIFVHRGLDAALNIDRESFNFGHPHAKIVTSWVHRALRQIATTQKRIAKSARDVRRTAVGLKQREQVTKIVESALEQAGADETPSVEIITPSSQRELFEQRKKGVLAFNREAVLANIPEPVRQTAANQQRRGGFEERLKAAAQLLEAYGLLSQLSYKDQQKLLNGLALIFWDYE